MKVKIFTMNVIYMSGVLLFFVEIHTVLSVPDDWPQATSFESDSEPMATNAFINVTRRVNRDGALFEVTECVEHGRFGTGFVGPAKGILVHIAYMGNSNDHTGCRLPLASTKPAGTLPPYGYPWIALMIRGECHFDTKVENAYQMGAEGVIIYNNRRRTTLEVMDISPHNVHCTVNLRVLCRQPNVHLLVELG